MNWSPQKDLLIFHVGWKISSFIAVDFFSSELQDIAADEDSLVQLNSCCPMTTLRNGRRYMATVGRGKDICLQGDNSDVQLFITAGCPQKAHLMDVRTDLSNFASEIPDNECFVAPVIEVMAPAKSETSAYILRIPHCLTTTSQRESVKITLQRKEQHTAPLLVEVPSRD